MGRQKDGGRAVTDSAGEAALKALAASISTGLPAKAQFRRNMAFSGEIPVGGLVILRDGDPGVPQVMMSPLSYTYTHAAEVDIMIEDHDQVARDAAFDKLRAAVGAAILENTTLGGAVEHAEAVAAGAVDLGAEGAEAIKAASIQVRLTYTTSDPLG
jgi:hypothetical protein